MISKGDVSVGVGLLFGFGGICWLSPAAAAIAFGAALVYIGLKLESKNVSESDTTST